jgi:hypothetical protein
MDNSISYQQKSMLSSPRIQTYLIIPLSLLFIQLFGHFGLFLGHTFLVEDDIASTLVSTAGDIHSMGWRSDIGLGFSSFYADPGIGHSWSLLRLWHRLFNDQILAFNISIFIFLWLISVTHHILLRRVFPELNSITLIFLASLISFGSLRYEFIFLRHLAPIIIATPIISLIILEHLEQPSIRQYFLYSLTLSFTLFLGSTSSLLFILIFSGFFFLSYIFYHWRSLERKNIFKKCTRFVVLNFFSGLSLVLLGAWVFYSIFLESQTIEYVRDPNYTPASFFVSVEPMFFFTRISQYFYPGLLSYWSGILGINQNLPIGSWALVAPIFPLILLVCLFLKSQNFWEFSAKFIVIISFIYIEVMTWFPGILDLIHSVINLYPPYKLYPFFQTFQVLLIGFFIQRIIIKEKTWICIKQNLVTLLAIILSLIYGFFVVLIILLQVQPQLIIQGISEILNWFSPLYIEQDTIQIVKNIARENIRLLQEYLRIPDVLFYVTTLSLTILFITKQWVKIIKLKRGLVFAAILLASNILLSWSVYPMNKEQLIWDKQIRNGSSLIKIFKKTDRIAWVGSKPCRGSINYFECVQKKFIDTPFGPRRYFVGYRWSRAPMELSGMKTHSPKDQALYLEALLRRENLHLSANIAGVPRYLSQRPSISKSKAFDLNAVNYLFSEDPLPKSDHLELIHASKQFFLYFNNQARPYFYLADKIEFFDNLGELYDAQKGTAYLKENTVSLSPSHRQRMLKLLEFKPGDLKFQYSSKADEFLVVRDTWHPFWKASVNGIERKIFKTNGTFKGIVLPSGQGSVHLFFDHSHYFPGIWISVIAWVFFILGWVSISFKNSNSTNFMLLLNEK